MINAISQLLIGFSIFSSLILLLAYVFYLPDMRKSAAGKLAGSFLLLALICLQFAHFSYFSTGVELLKYRFYGGLLIVIPPAFYFFSRVVLFPEIRHSLFDAWHFLPSLISLALPIQTLPVIAFMIGTGYTLWFSSTIFQLREQRSRFNFEMFFFGMFALMALLALVMGLSLPYIEPKYFYLCYANTISIAIFMVMSALVFYPELLSDIRQITELAYSKSRLVDVDQEAKLVELEQLMQQDKLYRDEDLSLAHTAELIDLSAHQLSELINTAFGHSFPKFVRLHRVKEAKALLIQEPSSSVLSIGMATGFKSQSTFYTAFKDIEGVSPGEYRKLNSH